MTERTDGKVSEQLAPDGLLQEEVQVVNARRRLIRGAASGAGVLLAVQARTALGQTVCQSPSATISGNTSPRPGQPAPCSGGRSPGFWKVPQHFQYWPTAGATAPTFNVPIKECASGMQNLEAKNIKTPGTLVSAVLLGTSVPSSAPPHAPAGIWEVLAFPTSFTNGQLMRHLICAWLNVGLFPTTYPITRTQVVDMWNATRSGGVYCPSGMSCGGGGMNATQVIAYISGMYDFNSALESDVCKA